MREGVPGLRVSEASVHGPVVPCSLDLWLRVVVRTRRGQSCSLSSPDGRGQERASVTRCPSRHHLSDPKTSPGGRLTGDQAFTTGAFGGHSGCRTKHPATFTVSTGWEPTVMTTARGRTTSYRTASFAC